MIDSIRFSQSVVQSLTQTGLPPPFTSLVTTHARMTQIWRTYRKQKIYINPDNTLNLTLGHGVNAFFGHLRIVQQAALGVLLGVRYFEIFEEVTKVTEAVEEWKSALRGEFAPHVASVWPKQQKGLLNASTMIWCNDQVNKGIVKLHKLALCTFKIIKHLFFLSLRLADLKEVHSFDQETFHEAVQLVFFNSHKGANWIVKNKVLIIQTQKTALRSHLLWDCLRRHNEGLDRREVLSKVHKDLLPPFPKNCVFLQNE